MRFIIKLVLTFVVLMIVGAITAAIREGMGTKVSTGGIGPIILYPAALAAIYAIWKYNPDKKSAESSDQQLRKD